MGKEITFDKFIRWAGVTLIVLAVLYMTNYLSSVLLPFFIAWFFAYLLYPVVKFIENKLHIRIRGIVPSLFPEPSATTSVLAALPELIQVTLMVSVPDTGTLTAR